MYSIYIEIEMLLIFPLIGFGLGQTLDPCLSGPCQSKAHCISNGLGQYQCICSDGWTGPNCNKDVNECEASPCEHDGVCRNKSGTYECLCPPGFYGSRCEKEVLECASSPCKNGGTCIDEINQFRCICPPGYKGLTCEYEINECALMPCKNGAQCEDLVDSYRCHCLAGFFGSHCEERIQACAHMPCQNNATCLNPSPLGRTDTIVELLNDTYVCRCLPGFSGKHCELKVNPCLPSPCLNGAKCVNQTNGNDNWMCQCARGYYGLLCEFPLASSPNAIDVKMTSLNDYENRSSNHSLATHTVVRFDCQQTPCLNGGSCFVLDVANATHLSVCVCLTNYSGSTCDQVVDPCVEMQCDNGGRCVSHFYNNQILPVCQCKAGFFDDHCELNKYDCWNNPCGPHGLCFDAIDGYECHCLSSKWTGPNCSNPDADQSPHSSLMTPLTWKANYLSMPTCPYRKCANWAQCNTSSGVERRCLCETAVGRFTGHYCDVDIDECSSGLVKCQNEGVCINTHGSYFCSCTPGFDGLHCEHRINPCNHSAGICMNGGQCTSRLDGFTCICPVGFVGTYCETEVNDCVPNNHCSPDEICLDLIGSHVCLNKFTKSSVALNCQSNCTNSTCSEQCSSDCAELCQNGGMCTIDSTLSNRPTCKCSFGYFGRHCEGMINFCRLNSTGPTLLSSFADDSIRQALIDSALADDALQTTGLCHPLGTRHCLPMVGNFSCVCHLNYQGRYCDQLIDSCARFENEMGQKFCLNDGQCINDFSNELNYPTSIQPKCLCRPNYFGKRCEEEVNRCAFYPRCLHGGQCQLSSGNSEDLSVSSSNVEQFACTCLPGWAGIYCEVNTRRACSYRTRCAINDTQCLDEQIECMCDKPGYCGLNCNKFGTECFPSISFANELISTSQSTTITTTAASVITNRTFYFNKTKNSSTLCEQRQCPTKTQNDQCDPECDLLECNFDQGDCLYALSKSLNSVNLMDPTETDDDEEKDKKKENELVKQRPEPAIPWINCTTTKQHILPCDVLFNDNKCDLACADEQCLFDGWDCVGDKQNETKNLCLSSQCRNKDDCNANQSNCTRNETTQLHSDTALRFNQFDSQPQNHSNTIIQGSLVLLIDCDPTELLDPNLVGFGLQLVANLSQLLRSDVRIRRHRTTGKPMVFPVPYMHYHNGNSNSHRKIRLIDDITMERVEFVWSNGGGQLVSRKARNVQPWNWNGRKKSNYFVGSQVYFQLDSAKCYQTGGPCFHQIDLVAQFLTAFLRRPSRNVMPKVLAIQSVRPDHKIPDDQTADDDQKLVDMSIYLLTMTFFVLVLMFLCGVFYTTSQYQHYRSNCDLRSTFKQKTTTGLVERKKMKKVLKAKIWYPLLDTIGHEDGGLPRCVNYKSNNIVLPPSNNNNNNSSELQITKKSSFFNSMTNFNYNQDESTTTHHHFVSNINTNSQAQIQVQQHNSKCDQVKCLECTNIDSSAIMMTEQFGRVGDDYSRHNANFGYDNQFPKLQNTCTNFNAHLTIQNMSYKCDNYSDKTDIHPPYMTQPTAYYDSNYSSSACRQFVKTEPNSNKYNIPLDCVENGSSNTSQDNGTVQMGANQTDSTSYCTWDDHVNRQTLADLVCFLNSKTYNNGKNNSNNDDNSDELSEFQKLLKQIIVVSSNSILSLQDFQQREIDVDFKCACRLLTQDPSSIKQHQNIAAANYDNSNYVNSMVAWQRVFKSAGCMRLLNLKIPKTGESLLHLAARFNHHEVVAVLLDVGIDFTAVDIQGRSALLSAISSGAIESVQTILNHPNVTFNPYCFAPSFLTDLTTPLMQSIKIGDFEIFKLILSAMNALIYSFTKQPILNETCHFDDLSNANVTEPDVSAYEESALMFLDINASDHSGRTALHWAVATNQPDMVSGLLNSGATYDAQTALDETPLVLGAKEGALQSCGLLLMAGANASITDYLDRTPKDLARLGSHQELVRQFEMFCPTVQIANASEWSTSRSNHHDLYFTPTNHVGKTSFSPIVCSESKLLNGTSAKARSKNLIDTFAYTSPNSEYDNKLSLFQSTTKQIMPIVKNSKTRQSQSYTDQLNVVKPMITIPTEIKTTDYCTSNEFHKPSGLNSHVRTIMGSDSESPNHWSSSPSDSSPHRNNQANKLSEDVLRTKTNMAGNLVYSNELKNAGSGLQTFSNSNLYLAASHNWNGQTNGEFTNNAHYTMIDGVQHPLF